MAYTKGAYIALAALVLQNTAVVLTMKASLQDDSKPYIVTVAVALIEVLKLAICLTYLMGYEGKSLAEIQADAFGSWKDFSKVAVPAGLYLVQNNLLYVAVSSLPPAIYQVSYQLKILTTAIFSVTMLRRKLEKLQWIALCVLVPGIVLVQLSNSSPSAVENFSSFFGSVVGLIAVLASTVTSGFAGVWFEKVLKSTPKSLWIRNIQLASCSVLIGIFSIVAKDFDRVLEEGALTGFSGLTCTVIVLQAAGGLIVALVVKAADNILKGFATSVSIIVSSILSIFLFNFHPSQMFCVGAALVVGSVIMYSYGGMARAHSAPHPASSKKAARVLATDKV